MITRGADMMLALAQLATVIIAVSAKRMEGMRPPISSSTVVNGSGEAATPDNPSAWMSAALTPI